MKLEQQVVSLELAKKLCRRCGLNKSVGEFYESRKYQYPSERYESYCKMCVRERTRTYYYANRERLLLRERNRKAANRPAILLQRTEQRKRLRLAAIEAYGGKCTCCSEATIAFLAIDHINGGGQKHMKEIGGPSNFMCWLRKNDYPPGFQILCHNCNMAKGLYKSCPHQNAN